MHAERKKAKGTKKCVIERELMFENYKDCLFNGGVILKSQQRFKCDRWKCEKRKWESKYKMINFDDYTSEKKLNIIQIGHILQINHTEY